MINSFLLYIDSVMSVDIQDHRHWYDRGGQQPPSHSDPSAT
ncbi:hypothetical protein C2W64_01434 [Brevibacillus laterosporus]|nr:hypothetical protein C2W64_01434 [Brevibacillus laterosporus]